MRNMTDQQQFLVAFLLQCHFVLTLDECVCKDFCIAICVHIQEVHVHIQFCYQTLAFIYTPIMA